MKQITVINSNTPENFQHQVNELLAKGYVLESTNVTPYISSDFSKQTNDFQIDTEFTYIAVLSFEQ